MGLLLPPDPGLGTGGGGLVAFALPWLRRLSETGAAVLGWAGLCAVVGSAAILTSSIPYPGVAALAPVLGTAAVIASGCARPARGPVLVLGRVGMQVIGRISYSWYLWHWPVLILAPYVVHHALSLAARTWGWRLASVVLALVSFVTVENPVRLVDVAAGPAPTRPAARGGPDRGRGGRVPASRIVALPSLTGRGVAPGPPPSLVRSRAAVPVRTEPSTSPPVNPTAARLASATAQVQAAVTRSVTVAESRPTCTPSLPDAAGDEPPVFVDGCLDSFLASNVQPCDFGDTSSAANGPALR